MLQRHFETLRQDPGWPLRGWPTMVDALAAAQSDDGAATLLALHHAGDQRAGLVLVMAVLPSLRTRAERRGIDVGDAVSALWLGLDGHRRVAPQRLRARLVLDACRDAVRLRPARELATGEMDPVVEPDDGPDPDDDPTAAGVLARGARLGLITPEQQTVLHAVHVAGMDEAAVARRLGVSVPAVRARRSRGLRRLAQNRPALQATA